MRLAFKNAGEFGNASKNGNGSKFGNERTREHGRACTNGNACERGSAGARVCRLCAVFLQSQSRIIRVLFACYWRVIGVFLPYFVQYDTYNSKRRIVMYCSNCNATYSTESLFCPLCGQRMSASPCALTLHNASNQALSSTAPFIYSKSEQAFDASAPLEATSLQELYASDLSPFESSITSTTSPCYKTPPTQTHNACLLYTSDAADDIL